MTEYYVVDGHHRVAMAKKLGQDYLDAHVVEHRSVPLVVGDRYSLIDWRSTASDTSSAAGQSSRTGWTPKSRIANVSACATVQ